MRLSPLDIQSQQFRTRIRGYDTREVENFLELVASEFEEMIRENGKLKEKLAKLTSQLDELKQREQTLKDTMMTAQKVTEDMKTVARKEADTILAQAELKAERMGLRPAAPERVVEVTVNGGRGTPAADPAR